MSLIYLTADDKNLGEVLDLQVVQKFLGPGEVWFLSHTAQRLRFRYRRELVKRIRGKIPVVAGGGTLMSYFKAFWDAVPYDQKFLFVGTGVCWHYDRCDAIQINPLQVDSSSRFRGPVLPLGYSTRKCILPPGVLFQVERKAPRYVLSVLHPMLIDTRSQNQFAAEVARHLGIPLVESTNHVSDLALYEEAALVISSRLHAAVLSAGNGIPCFVLSRDHKIDWFCNQIAMEYASIPVMHFGRLPSALVRLAAETKAVTAGPKVVELESYLVQLARTLEE